MENNPAGVSILCNISGTVESRTCGTNGPAIIDSVAITNYVAIKRMTFDGKLFTSNPASVTSCTLRFRSRADGVELAVGHPLQSQTDSKESQPPISESVEVWFMQNENLVANRPMATILFNKVPTWLSTYLSDNPLFQTPDDRKWGFELDEKWIILKLHE